MNELEARLNPTFFLTMTETEVSEVYNKLVDKYNKLIEVLENTKRNTVLKSGHAPNNLKNYQIKYTQLIQYDDGICGKYENGSILDLDTGYEYYLQENYAKLMIETAERRAATERKRTQADLKHDKSIEEVLKKTDNKIKQLISSLDKGILSLSEKYGISVEPQDVEVLKNWCSKHITTKDKDNE